MNKFLTNKWAVSLTAGILLGLSFPPVDLSYLSIPAFILLIHLANSVDSYKELIKFSFPGFLVWNLITTYWLMMASVGAGIGANIANSLIMVIPLCFMRFFQERFSTSYIVVSLQAASWVTYEFLHHNWDLAWPWLTIGNAWANQVGLIQYISLTGHLGISLWVILTAAFAYQALQYHSRQLALYTVLILLIPPAVSLAYFGFTNPQLEAENSVRVTVIQPNHDSYQDFGGMSGNREVIDSLFSITNKIKQADSELIVWPENAIESAVLLDSYEVNRVADSAAAWQANFIVGIGLITTYPQGSAPDLYRGYYRGSVPFNVYNSALFVDANRSISQYHKRSLVPFVERFPFVNFFATIDIFDWFDWGLLAGYGKGELPSMLKTPNFITTGLICYDSVYPGWIREFVNSGAGFITIITNDGWWGNSSGHLQHFAYARLRAIEFNRWVVRSANNGTSGIIRSDGTVEQKTKFWLRTGFNSTIPVLTNQTVYARFGDWLAYQSLGLVLTFWVIGLLYPKSFTNLIE